MLYRLVFLLFVTTSVVKLISADDEPCATTVNGHGVCIDIDKCPIIVKQPGNIPPRDAMDCGHGNDKVCCPYQVSTHRNSHLLTRNICGSPQDPAHDQQVARVNEFPWMALLVYNSETRPYQCGGSIITERYILTNAACVTHELSRVRVGEHTLSTARDCQSYMGAEFCAPGHQEFDIEKRIPHEFYESSDLAHNIALLRLSESIDLSRANVMPVCLPLAQSLQVMPLDGKRMTLIGWPLVGKFSQADSLHKMQVIVVSNEECELLYQNAKLQSYLDGQYMMCASGSEPYPCRGNAGGPLALAVPLRGRPHYVQWGVASHGSNSCVGPPEVYVRVTSYMGWILNNIQP